MIRAPIRNAVAFAVFVAILCVVAFLLVGGMA